MADITASVIAWSATEASNSPTGDTTIGAGLDDNLRAIQAGTVKEFLKGSDVASASTVNLGASGSYGFVDVTGTTGITSLGTAPAGTIRKVRFTGALTLTHNATSLILPGKTNITTANGDQAEFVSLGSGNWACTKFMPINCAFPKRSTPYLGREMLEAFVTAVDGGTDAYAGTSSQYAITFYVTHGMYLVKFDEANTTTTPTINIDSVGAKTIKRQGGGALYIGDIAVDRYCLLQYDGTDMYLLNPAIVATTKFTSSNQTITSAGTLTLAHGLPGKPTKLWYGLVNTSNEYGWSGEELPQAFGPQDASGTVARGATAYADTTNVYVQFGSAPSVFNVHQKTGTPGLTAAADNSKWQIKVYAEL